MPFPGASRRAGGRSSHGARLAFSQQAGKILRSESVQLGASLPSRFAESSGTTYYVRTDGNDSNDGLTNSSGGAWASIQHAMENAGDNAIVKVVAGTYTESFTITGGGSNSSNVITVEAESGTKPVLLGNLTFQGVSAAFWRMRNIIFDANSANPSACKATYTGADSDAANVGAHDIEWYGCEARNVSSAGAGWLITGSSCTRLHWWNCLSHDNDPTLTTTHGWYLDGGTDFHLINCIARDNGGYGFHVYDGSGAQLVRDVYFYNCLGISQQERGGWLVRGDSSDVTRVPQNVHLYNSIAAFNDEGSGTQSGLRFHAAGISDFSSYDLCTVESCLSYGNLNGDVAGTNNASMYTASNFITGSDPLFTDASTNDFTLQGGSPCIGAGLADYTPTFDYDGNARSAADIGPFAA